MMLRVEQLKPGDAFIMDGIEHSVVQTRKIGDYVEVTTGTRICFLLQPNAMVWDSANEES